MIFLLKLRIDFFRTKLDEGKNFESINELREFISQNLNELKKFESHTLHFPLIPEDYLFSHDNLDLLKDPHQHKSCRSQPIRIYLAIERALLTMDKLNNEKHILAKSIQQKRASTTRQLTLCSNKRSKIV